MLFLIRNNYATVKTNIEYIFALEKRPENVILNEVKNLIYQYVAQMLRYAQHDKVRQILMLRFCLRMTK